MSKTEKQPTENNSTPLKCGLIMPISAIDGCTELHWNEVRSIIKESMEDTPFSVELVSDSNEIGIIQKRIVQNVYSNDLVICDVSGKNPNVMFELGLRLAFDRPAIIIKDDQTNYSFDTANIEHIEYPRDLHYHGINAFKETLKTKALATFKASKRENYTSFLKQFGEFVVSDIKQEKVGAEEYILQTLAELKDGILSLSRHLTTSQQTRLFPYHGVNSEVISIDAIQQMASQELERRYGSAQQRKANLFVRSYLTRQDSGVDATLLADIKSKEFAQLLKSYLEEFSTPLLETSADYRLLVEKSLISAVLKLTS